VKVVQNDQGILSVLPGRGEKPAGPIAGHHLDFVPFLLGQGLKEGVQDALAVFVVIPDDAR
jgi:hypothetical protein